MENDKKELEMGEVEIVAAEATTAEIQSRAMNFDLTITARIEEFVIITTVSQYERAADLMLALKSVDDKIDKFFEPFASTAYKAHKAITTSRAKERAPVQQAIEKIKKSMLDFVEEQERIRREEEIRQQAIAKKAAEDDKIREAAAAAIDSQSDANDILEEEIIVPTVHVQSAIPHVAGLVLGKTWTHDIIDESLLPRRFLKPDDDKIKRYVAAMKGSANIPGVKVYQRSGLSRR